MSDEIDPEVEADLRFRAHSQYDRSRTGEVKFQPSPVIGRVPCRQRCGATVDWTEEAEDRFNMFNKVLASKMEAPLDKTRVVFCRKCKCTGLEASAKNNREVVERTAQLIRELKSDPPVDSDREREILEKLAKVHPDLEGLKQAIKTRRDSKPQGSRVRRNSF